VGYAGAIIADGKADAESNIAAMGEAGIKVSPPPARLGKTLVEVERVVDPLLFARRLTQQTILPALWRLRHSVLRYPLYLQQCSICARFNELKGMFTAGICRLVCCTRTACEKLTSFDRATRRDCSFCS
jgi:hypothetical protein